MERRTVLRSLGGLASGSIVVAAGCLGEGGDGHDAGTTNTTDGSGGEPDASAREGSTADEAAPDQEWLAELPTMPAALDPSPIALSYPRYRASYYPITARRSSADASVDFTELSSAERIEVANAIGRSQYLTADPAVLDAERHHETVAYRGDAYDITVAVADRFQEPEHGPRGDSDWRAPITVETVTDGTHCWVRLRNELDQPLPIHHYGRPCFGVLTAVGESAATLDHPAYDENASIHTDGTIRTERIGGERRRTDRLAAGASVTERYALPPSLPENSRVWVSVRIGGESTELLGNQSTSATGTARVV